MEPVGEHEADPMVDTAGSLDDRGAEIEGQHSDIYDKPSELDERHAELAERLSRGWRGRSLRGRGRKGRKHRADDSWLEEISAGPPEDGRARPEPSEAGEPARAQPPRTPEQDARMIMAAAGRLAQAAGSVFARPESWETAAERAWLSEAARQLDRLVSARSPGTQDSPPDDPSPGTDQPSPAEASTSSMGATAPA